MFSITLLFGDWIYSPTLRDAGPHLCISGEEQIQGGVKARKITQDLMIRDERKEREALAHPGRSKPDLDPTSREGGALNSLALYP